ncbi:unnamed protein product, partial [Ixodes persulcatus]
MCTSIASYILTKPGRSPRESAAEIEERSRLEGHERRSVFRFSKGKKRARGGTTEATYSCSQPAGDLAERKVGATAHPKEGPTRQSSKHTPLLYACGGPTLAACASSVARGHFARRAPRTSSFAWFSSLSPTSNGIMNRMTNFSSRWRVMPIRVVLKNKLNSAFLLVPPMWTTEPTNGNVVVGETVVLDCAADGFPVPRIAWKRAEGDEPRNFERLTTSYRVQMLSNGSLVVQDAEISDSGFYLCEAHNGIGAGLSRVVSLSVNVPPSFSTKFSSQNVKRGQDAVLRCDASGDPELIIMWEKDKQPIDLTIEKRYSLFEETLDGRLASSLTIASTERWDGALYTCIVRNPLGSDETNVQLLVQEPPSAPTEVRAAKIASRTVEIMWSPSYNGNS